MKSGSRKFKRLLMAAYVMGGALIYATGSASQDSNRSISCENWFSGKIAGYQFWGKADISSIRLCVAKYGVNRRNPFNATPLLHALANRDVSIGTVDLLISLGADINAKNKYHVTPLIMATRYVANPDIITFLVAKGARIEDRDAYGVRARDLVTINPRLPLASKAKLIELLTPKP